MVAASLSAPRIHLRDGQEDEGLDVRGYDFILMLIEISTTAQNADDLGYLLHKHPANVFERNLPFGKMRVFYTEATKARCSVVLWLDLDQADLVRKHGKESFALAQYVNDRPYVASSYLAVALGQAFSSAIGGRANEKTERVDEEWPLEITLPTLDCDSGEPFIREIFEPLGYAVDAQRLPLDQKFPQWGESTLYRLKLSCRKTVRDALSQLYVLLPVLDNQKHYAFGDDEVAKLIDKSGAWLGTHPMKEAITRRYLRYRRKYVFDALEKLAVDTVDEEPANTDIEAPQAKEDALETRMSLHEQRLHAVCEALKGANLRRVVDLGCGEGKLMRLLLKDSQWQEIVGMDVSSQALQIAMRRLYMDRDGAPSKLKLMHGSLMYRDERLCGFDAAALVEVIEHIELDRLEFLERNVFGYAKPTRVVVTTPNSEYNPHWESLSAGAFRHRDHRFEWTRKEFDQWAGRIAEQFNYNVTISGIGDEDPSLGAPSQMAVFDRE